MPETIRLDEWLSELSLLTQRNAEGFTTDEMADLSRKSTRWVREMLRKSISAGFVQMVGHRTIYRIDGRPTPIPVYRVVKKKGKKP